MNQFRASLRTPTANLAAHPSPPPTGARRPIAISTPRIRTASSSQDSARVPTPISSPTNTPSPPSSQGSMVRKKTLTTSRPDDPTVNKKDVDPSVRTISTSSTKTAASTPLARKTTPVRPTTEPGTGIRVRATTPSPVPVKTPEPKPMTTNIATPRASRLPLRATASRTSTGSRASTATIDSTTRTVKVMAVKPMAMKAKMSKSPPVSPTPLAQVATTVSPTPVTPRLQPVIMKPKMRVAPASSTSTQSTRSNVRDPSNVSMTASIVSGSTLVSSAGIKKKTGLREPVTKTLKTFEGEEVEGRCSRESCAAIPTKTKLNEVKYIRPPTPESKESIMSAPPSSNRTVIGKVNSKTIILELELPNKATSIATVGSKKTSQVMSKVVSTVSSPTASPLASPTSVKDGKQQVGSSSSSLPTKKRLPSAVSESVTEPKKPEQEKDPALEEHVTRKGQVPVPHHVAERLRAQPPKSAPTSKEKTADKIMLDYKVLEHVTKSQRTSMSQDQIMVKQPPQGKGQQDTVSLGKGIKQQQLDSQTLVKSSKIQSESSKKTIKRSSSRIGIDEKGTKISSPVRDGKHHIKRSALSLVDEPGVKVQSKQSSLTVNEEGKKNLVKRSSPTKISSNKAGAKNVAIKKGFTKDRVKLGDHSKLGFEAEERQEKENVRSFVLMVDEPVLKEKLKLLNRDDSTSEKSSDSRKLEVQRKEELMQQKLNLILKEQRRRIEDDDPSVDEEMMSEEIDQMIIASLDSFEDDEENISIETQLLDNIDDTLITSITNSTTQLDKLIGLSSGSNLIEEELGRRPSIETEISSLVEMGNLPMSWPVSPCDQERLSVLSRGSEGNDEIISFGKISGNRYTTSDQSSSMKAVFESIETDQSAYSYGSECPDELSSDGKMTILFGDLSRGENSLPESFDIERGLLMPYDSEGQDEPFGKVSFEVCHKKSDLSVGNKTFLDSMFNESITSANNMEFIAEFTRDDIDIFTGQTQETLDKENSLNFSLYDSTIKSKLELDKIPVKEMQAKQEAGMGTVKKRPLTKEEKRKSPDKSFDSSNEEIDRSIQDSKKMSRKSQQSPKEDVDKSSSGSFQSPRRRTNKTPEESELSVSQETDKLSAKTSPKVHNEVSFDDKSLSKSATSSRMENKSVDKIIGSRDKTPVKRPQTSKDETCFDRKHSAKSLQATDQVPTDKNFNAKLSTKSLQAKGDELFGNANVSNTGKDDLPFEIFGQAEKISIKSSMPTREELGLRTDSYDSKMTCRSLQVSKEEVVAANDKMSTKSLQGKKSVLAARVSSSTAQIKMSSTALKQSPTIQSALRAVSPTVKRSASTIKTTSLSFQEKGLESSDRTGSQPATPLKSSTSTLKTPSPTFYDKRLEPNGRRTSPVQSSSPVKMSSSALKLASPNSNLLEKGVVSPDEGLSPSVIKVITPPLQAHLPAVKSITPPFSDSAKRKSSPKSISPPPTIQEKGPLSSLKTAAHVKPSMTSLRTISPTGNIQEKTSRPQSPSAPLQDKTAKSPSPTFSLNEKAWKPPSPTISSQEKPTQKILKTQKKLSAANLRTLSPTQSTPTGKTSPVMKAVISSVDDSLSNFSVETTRSISPSPLFETKSAKDTTSSTQIKKELLGARMTSPTLKIRESPVSFTKESSVSFPQSKRITTSPALKPVTQRKKSSVNVNVQSTKDTGTSPSPTMISSNGSNYGNIFKLRGHSEDDEKLFKNKTKQSSSSSETLISHLKDEIDSATLTLHSQKQKQLQSGTQSLKPPVPLTLQSGKLPNFTGTSPSATDAESSCSDKQQGTIGTKPSETSIDDSLQQVAPLLLGAIVRDTISSPLIPRAKSTEHAGDKVILPDSSSISSGSTIDRTSPVLSHITGHEEECSISKLTFALGETQLDDFDDNRMGLYTPPETDNSSLLSENYNLSVSSTVSNTSSDSGYRIGAKSFVDRTLSAMASGAISGFMKLKDFVQGPILESPINPSELSGTSTTSFARIESRKDKISSSPVPTDNSSLSLRHEGRSSPKADSHVKFSDPIDKVMMGKSQEQHVVDEAPRNLLHHGLDQTAATQEVKLEENEKLVIKGKNAPEKRISPSPSPETVARPKSRSSSRKTSPVPISKTISGNQDVTSSTDVYSETDTLSDDVLIIKEKSSIKSKIISGLKKLTPSSTPLSSLSLGTRRKSSSSSSKVTDSSTTTLVSYNAPSDWGSISPETVIDEEDTSRTSVDSEVMMSILKPSTTNIHRRNHSEGVEERALFDLSLDVQQSGNLLIQQPPHEDTNSMLSNLVPPNWQSNISGTSIASKGLQRENVPTEEPSVRPKTPQSNVHTTARTSDNATIREIEISIVGTSTSPRQGLQHGDSNLNPEFSDDSAGVELTNTAARSSRKSPITRLSDTTTQPSDVRASEIKPVNKPQPKVAQASRTSNDTTKMNDLPLSSKTPTEKDKLSTSSQRPASISPPSNLRPPEDAQSQEIKKHQFSDTSPVSITTAEKDDTKRAVETSTKTPSDSKEPAVANKVNDQQNLPLSPKDSKPLTDSDFFSSGNASLSSTCPYDSKRQLLDSKDGNSGLTPKSNDTPKCATTLKEPESVKSERTAINEIKPEGLISKTPTPLIERTFGYVTTKVFTEPTITDSSESSKSNTSSSTAGSILLQPVTQSKKISDNVTELLSSLEAKLSAKTTNSNNEKSPYTDDNISSRTLSSICTLSENITDWTDSSTTTINEMKGDSTLAWASVDIISKDSEIPSSLIASPTSTATSVDSAILNQSQNSSSYASEISISYKRNKEDSDSLLNTTEDTVMVCISKDLSEITTMPESKVFVPCVRQSEDISSVTNKVILAMKDENSNDSEQSSHQASSSSYDSITVEKIAAATNLEVDVEFFSSPTSPTLSVKSDQIQSNLEGRISSSSPSSPLEGLPGFREFSSMRSPRIHDNVIQVIDMRSHSVPVEPNTSNKSAQAGQTAQDANISLQTRVSSLPTTKPSQDVIFSVKTRGPFPISPRCPNDSSLSLPPSARISESNVLKPPSVLKISSSTGQSENKMYNKDQGFSPIKAESVVIDKPSKQSSPLSPKLSDDSTVRKVSRGPSPLLTKQSSPLSPKLSDDSTVRKVSRGPSPLLTKLPEHVSTPDDESSKLEQGKLSSGLAVISSSDYKDTSTSTSQLSGQKHSLSTDPEDKTSVGTSMSSLSDHMPPKMSSVVKKSVEPSIIKKSRASSPKPSIVKKSDEPSLNRKSRASSPIPSSKDHSGNKLVKSDLPITQKKASTSAATITQKTNTDVLSEDQKAISQPNFGSQRIVVPDFLPNKLEVQVFRGPTPDSLQASATVTADNMEQSLLNLINQDDVLKIFSVALTTGKLTPELREILSEMFKKASDSRTIDSSTESTQHPTESGVSDSSHDSKPSQQLSIEQHQQELLSKLSDGLKTGRLTPDVKKPVLGFNATEKMDAIEERLKTVSRLLSPLSPMSAASLKSSGIAKSPAPAQMSVLAPSTGSVEFNTIEETPTKQNTSPLNAKGTGIDDIAGKNTAVPLLGSSLNQNMKNPSVGLQVPTPKASDFSSEMKFLEALLQETEWKGETVTSVEKAAEGMEKPPKMSTMSMKDESSSQQKEKIKLSSLSLGEEPLKSNAKPTSWSVGEMFKKPLSKEEEKHLQSKFGLDMTDLLKNQHLTAEKTSSDDIIAAFENVGPALVVLERKSSSADERPMSTLTLGKEGGQTVLADDVSVLQENNTTIPFNGVNETYTKQLITGLDKQISNIETPDTATDTSHEACTPAVDKADSKPFQRWKSIGKQIQTEEKQELEPSIKSNQTGPFQAKNKDVSLTPEKYICDHDIGEPITSWSRIAADTVNSLSLFENSWTSVLQNTSGSQSELSKPDNRILSETGFHEPSIVYSVQSTEEPAPSPEDTGTINQQSTYILESEEWKNDSMNQSVNSFSPFYVNLTTPTESSYSSTFVQQQYLGENLSMVPGSHADIMLAGQQFGNEQYVNANETGQFLIGMPYNQNYDNERRRSDPHNQNQMLGGPSGQHFLSESKMVYSPHVGCSMPYQRPNLQQQGSPSASPQSCVRLLDRKIPQSTPAVTKLRADATPFVQSAKTTNGFAASINTSQYQSITTNEPQQFSMASPNASTTATTYMHLTGGPKMASVPGSIQYQHMFGNNSIFMDGRIDHVQYPYGRQYMSDQMPYDNLKDNYVQWQYQINADRKLSDSNEMIPEPVADVPKPDSCTHWSSGETQRIQGYDLAKSMDRHLESAPQVSAGASVSSNDADISESRDDSDLDSAHPHFFSLVDVSLAPAFVPSTVSTRLMSLNQTSTNTTVGARPITPGPYLSHNESVDSQLDATEIPPPCNEHLFSQMKESSGTAVSATLTIGKEFTGMSSLLNDQRMIQHHDKEPHLTGSKLTVVIPTSSDNDQKLGVAYSLGSEQSWSGASLHSEDNNIEQTSQQAFMQGIKDWSENDEAERMSDEDFYSRENVMPQESLRTVTNWNDKLTRMSAEDFFQQRLYRQKVDDIPFDGNVESLREESRMSAEDFFKICNGKRRQWQRQDSNTSVRSAHMNDRRYSHIPRYSQMNEQWPQHYLQNMSNAYLQNNYHETDSMNTREFYPKEHDVYRIGEQFYPKNENASIDHSYVNPLTSQNVGQMSDLCSDYYVHDASQYFNLSAHHHFMHNKQDQFSVSSPQVTTPHPEDSNMPITMIGEKSGKLFHHGVNGISIQDSIDVPVSLSTDGEAGSSTCSLSSHKDTSYIRMCSCHGLQHRFGPVGEMANLIPGKSDSSMYSKNTHEAISCMTGNNYNSNTMKVNSSSSGVELLASIDPEMDAKKVLFENRLGVESRQSLTREPLSVIPEETRQSAEDFYRAKVEAKWRQEIGKNKPSLDNLGATAIFVSPQQSELFVPINGKTFDEDFGIQIPIVEQNSLQMQPVEVEESDTQTQQVFIVPIPPELLPESESFELSKQHIENRLGRLVEVELATILSMPQAESLMVVAESSVVELLNKYRELNSEPSLLELSRSATSPNTSLTGVDVAGNDDEAIITIVAAANLQYSAAYRLEKFLKALSHPSMDNFMRSESRMSDYELCAKPSRDEGCQTGDLSYNAAIEVAEETGSSREYLEDIMEESGEYSSVDYSGGDQDAVEEDALRKEEIENLSEVASDETIQKNDSCHEDFAKGEAGDDEDDERMSAITLYKGKISRSLLDSSVESIEFTSETSMKEADSSANPSITVVTEDILVDLDDKESPSEQQLVAISQPEQALFDKWKGNQSNHVTGFCLVEQPALMARERISTTIRKRLSVNDLKKDDPNSLMNLMDWPEESPVPKPRKSPRSFELEKFNKPSDLDMQKNKDFINPSNKDFNSLKDKEFYNLKNSDFEKCSNKDFKPPTPSPRKPKTIEGGINTDTKEETHSSRPKTPVLYLRLPKPPVEIPSLPPSPSTTSSNTSPTFSPRSQTSTSTSDSQPIASPRSRLSPKIQNRKLSPTPQCKESSVRLAKTNEAYEKSHSRSPSPMPRRRHTSPQLMGSRSPSPLPRHRLPHSPIEPTNPGPGEKKNGLPRGEQNVRNNWSPTPLPRSSPRSGDDGNKSITPKSSHTDILLDNLNREDTEKCNKKSIFTDENNQLDKGKVDGSEIQLKSSPSNELERKKSLTSLDNDHNENKGPIKTDETKVEELQEATPENDTTSCGASAPGPQESSPFLVETTSLPSTPPPSPPPTATLEPIPEVSSQTELPVKRAPVKRVGPLKLTKEHLLSPKFLLELLTPPSMLHSKPSPLHSNSKTQQKQWRVPSPLPLSWLLPQSLPYRQLGIPQLSHIGSLPLTRLEADSNVPPIPKPPEEWLPPRLTLPSLQQASSQTLPLITEASISDVDDVWHPPSPTPLPEGAVTPAPLAMETHIEKVAEQRTPMPIVDKDKDKKTTSSSSVRSSSPTPKTVTEKPPPARPPFHKPPHLRSPSPKTKMELQENKRMDSSMQKRELERTVSTHFEEPPFTYNFPERAQIFGQNLTPSSTRVSDYQSTNRHSPTRPPFSNLEPEQYQPDFNADFSQQRARWSPRPQLQPTRWPRNGSYRSPSPRSNYQQRPTSPPLQNYQRPHTPHFQQLPRYPPSPDRIIDQWFPAAQYAPEEEPYHQYSFPPHPQSVNQRAVHYLEDLPPIPPVAVPKRVQSPYSLRTPSPRPVSPLRGAARLPSPPRSSKCTTPTRGFHRTASARSMGHWVPSRDADISPSQLQAPLQLHGVNKLYALVIEDESGAESDESEDAVQTLEEELIDHRVINHHIIDHQVIISEPGLSEEEDADAIANALHPEDDYPRYSMYRHYHRASVKRVSPAYHQSSMSPFQFQMNAIGSMGGLTDRKASSPIRNYFDSNWNSENGAVGGQYPDQHMEMVSSDSDEELLEVREDELMES